MLEIKTLGGLSIRHDGHEIKTLKSHKAEALLIYLLVEQRVQQRSALSAMLWPENTQEAASRSLRVVLSRLRSHLGDSIKISRQSVEVAEPAKIRLDIHLLENKLANKQIDAALEICKGAFLEGFTVHDSAPFEDWMRNRAESIHNQIVTALEDALLEVMENCDYENGERYAKEILKRDPLNEVAHKQYMLIYAMTGRRSEALSHFQLYCEKYQKELQLEPSEESKSIYAEIIRGGYLDNGSLLKKLGFLNHKLVL